MTDASPWTRFKQGIGQDLRRVWDRLGPARARVQDSWRSLSLPYKLCFVVVGIGFLVILASQAFSWDALRIAVLSQDPWHIGIAGIVFILIALLVLLWRWPKRKATRLNLDPKQQFDVENETRKTWATIAGGMVVLVSLLFTWGNLRVTQENLRITQETATKSQDLTREGQITDRFTKAIAQLGEQGPEKLAVRLGGIYALERIARDSEKDHWPIMEVVMAYVRENAPWPAKDAPSSGCEQLPQEASPATQDQLPKLPADVQAILTVLGRRTQSYEKEEQRLNLTRTNLHGASLGGAHLQRADLVGAHLERALLGGIHLERANLAGAHLEGALLEGAYLNPTVLMGTHLKRAFLTNAHLEGAVLAFAHLEGAHMMGAHLEGAQTNLWRACLERANLWQAHLEGAMLQEVHLKGANLWQAHLEGADLQQADLEGAILRDAHLEGANLAEANLKEALGLTVEQLATAKTLYRADIDPPLMKQIQQLHPQLLEKPQE
jgi:uncharacterized protein YjbI with pentapeptide repeats